ncbi:MAG TPA: peptide deformylase [Bacteroidota bacterium]|nr:peptide deformylase [Bacteroidota bacterium]
MKTESAVSLLPIYLYGSDVLKQKAARMSEVTDEDIRLIQDMLETMHEANGIGLAATQVGILKQLLVIDLSDSDESGEMKPMAIINPEIIAEEGRIEIEEGCLSIPDIREPVKRPEKITVRFHDTSMTLQELTAEGMLARVIQHEMDHLNGILFIDHLSTAKRTFLKNKLRKISKGEVDIDYEFVVDKKKTKR